MFRSFMVPRNRVIIVVHAHCKTLSVSLETLSVLVENIVRARWKHCPCSLETLSVLIGNIVRAHWLLGYDEHAFVSRVSCCKMSIRTTLKRLMPTKHSPVVSGH